MEIIDRYRRSLRRKNYAAHTVKAYMNVLAQFTRWLDAPLERVIPARWEPTWITSFKNAESENGHVPFANHQSLL